MTNAEARFNKSLRPQKPEGLLGQTTQDGHLDSHTAPELWPCPLQSTTFIYQTPCVQLCTTYMQNQCLVLPIHNSVVLTSVAFCASLHPDAVSSRHFTLCIVTVCTETYQFVLVSNDLDPISRSQEHLKGQMLKTVIKCNKKNHSSPQPLWWLPPSNSCLVCTSEQLFCMLLHVTISKVG